MPKFDVQLKKGTHFASSSWPCAYSSRARAAQSAGWFRSVSARHSGSVYAWAAMVATAVGA